MSSFVLYLCSVQSLCWLSRLYIKKTVTLQHNHPENLGLFCSVNTDDSAIPRSLENFFEWCTAICFVVMQCHIVKPSIFGTNLKTTIFGNKILKTKKVNWLSLICQTIFFNIYQKLISKICPIYKFCAYMETKSIILLRNQVPNDQKMTVLSKMPFS